MRTHSHQMYMVAAQVIETYSGRPYTSFVEERIFAPLEMSFSTFSPTKAEATGKFTQGWTKEARRALCFTEEMASVMAGPGGIISNSVDMVRLWMLPSMFARCRPNGSRRGSEKAFMTIELSFHHLYTRTRRTLTPLVPTTQRTRNTPSLDMAWVGSVAHTAGTT